MPSLARTAPQAGWRLIERATDREILDLIAGYYAGDLKVEWCGHRNFQVRG